MDNGTARVHTIWQDRAANAIMNENFLPKELRLWLRCREEMQFSEELNCM